MGRWRLWLGLLAILLNASILLVGQELDSIASGESRSPAVLADEISDPAERADFLSLFQKRDATSVLQHAQAFLQSYPQSSFLASVLEIAARNSFDLKQFKTGLEYARQSLQLLPENPLLLVAVADVEAARFDNDAAIFSAQDALTYLAEFAHPSSVSERDWPSVNRRQQATAQFVIGRAKLQKALKSNPPDVRYGLLKDAEKSLSLANELDPADEEIQYLQGVTYLSNGDRVRAAQVLAPLLKPGGAYATQAHGGLQTLYAFQNPGSTATFDQFVRSAARGQQTTAHTGPSPSPAARGSLSEYAGSEACAGCHAGIDKNWRDSGMSKMFRPYQAANILGDFEKNNQFYSGGDIQYKNGKLELSEGSRQAPLARMVLRQGRHYFDIRQSDGRWHSYPVDYTIGSKWQQAYATRLPNGQIHVFPIQYNVVVNKWVNYWKAIDGNGTERSDPNTWERLDSSTSYQAKCAVCHTSQLRNRKRGGLDADNLEFKEPGINCEMCHGPSARHIASITNGDTYDKQPLDPPVDFLKISGREFVNICAQCHRQSNIRKPGELGELNYSTTGTFFQQYLSVPLGEFTRKGFYKDGRFSQTTFIVEALERSQCFRKGAVSCGNCHDPHGHGFSSNQTSLRFKDQPDLMCVGCHSQFADKVSAAAHTHHALESEASRCVSCHMPKIADALLFRARTHQIDDIPNAATALRFGQSESPNACLMCHSDKDARWLQTALSSWRSKSDSRLPGTLTSLRQP